MVANEWCGTDLADAHDVGIARSHQVHDLPEVRIKVSEPGGASGL
jgi:hypothetical protein